MASDGYDCIVIGSGPGGYVAAIRAAQLGMRTVVIEKDAVGGRCLNYACIPAKVVLRSADILSEVREAGEYGIRVGTAEVDFAAIGKRREQVISTLTGGVAGLFKKNHIDVLEGEAGLTAAGGVRIGDDELHAKTVVLATGSVPKPIPGTTLGDRVLGTEDAWALQELPGRLAIVGAGASGCELASAYVRLGSEVLLVEGLDRVLPTEDADVSKAADRQFRRQGIEVVTGQFVQDVEKGAQGVSFTVGGERREADFLVIATGRGPDVAALGLDDAGVERDDAGLLRVDGALRTSRDGVYAIGDIVPGPALAHKASDEGIIAVEDAAGLETHPLAYPDIPRATFCLPNVGSFGLTEQQARDAGHDVVVGKVQYGAVGGGTVYGDRQGLVKIIGDRRYGELVGGHICGSRATEMIQELVNVRALEGGYAEVARMVHGHPTLTEAIMEAARAADGWLIHG
ncbi:MAG: dihydrolipoyl dehydrogenase [Solirubrobacterales bacterium]|nr:dihydrolipoyl dehydrogenase [Solirubrobacterales bacterium]